MNHFLTPILNCFLFFFCSFVLTWVFMGMFFIQESSLRWIYVFSVTRILSNLRLTWTFDYFERLKTVKELEEYTNLFRTYLLWMAMTISNVVGYHLIMTFILGIWYLEQMSMTWLLYAIKYFTMLSVFICCLCYCFKGLVF